MRICAVVSCRRRRTSPRRRECSTPAMSSATSTATTNSPPSRMTFDAVEPDSREKKSESRITVAKSAIVPAAMTSWPKVEPISSASLSTGTSTPSEVADSTMATNSGCGGQAARLQRQPHDDRERRSETAKPSSASRRTRPRRR